MSVWSDVKRAMRPAEITEREFRALRTGFKRTLSQYPPEGARVEVPGISHAGKPYLLVLHVRVGRLDGFEVDHDPDLSAPAFDAYTDFRAKIEREKAATNAQ